MSSLIEGYNYDIFISYRQKDNRHDGWVTEFVNSLKGELEATFKEEISVYFDMNPHDGLLETHDVDASLKEKLKCLVFIPIISRTYCDPKSFAWEHEFKAFVEQASQDHFGLKVKLSNGNVANRVLPVRIHDLDPGDIKECEIILGGVLRGVEFIYKEPGADKPLSPGDNEKKNLNNTVYSIQIIRVVHAIKEVILGMKAVPASELNEKVMPEESAGDMVKERNGKIQKSNAKSTSLKWLTGLLISAVLVVALLIIYPRTIDRDTLERLRSSGERISVAVMPFQNMTNDTIWDVWQKGIQDILITSLSNSEELTVRQAESINLLVRGRGIVNYSSLTPSVASTFSQKLDASVLIYGSIKQAGSTTRIYAQLINPKTKEVFKSFQIEGLNREEDIFYLGDTLSIMVRNFLIVSELKKQELIDHSNLVSTNSPEAMRYFLQGRDEFANGNFQPAITLFSKAIALDSNFIQAMLSNSLAYGNQYALGTTFSTEWGQYLYGEAKKWCLKAYKKIDQMTVQQKINTNWVHANYFGTPYDRIKYLEQLIELDNQQATAYFNMGGSYYDLYQYDKAIPFYEKALKIYKSWGINPFWVFNYTDLGQAYQKTGQFRKADKIYKKAEENFPDHLQLIGAEAILAQSLGDTVKANKLIDKLVTELRAISISEVDIASMMAYGYNESGSFGQAEKYYRQALSLKPDEPDLLNNLAYFLIDRDQNINEGLSLAEKAIRLDPENFYFMHTMGWGLYKQGKYKEALELLHDSWELRMEKSVYDHAAFLHLEAAKKAVAGQKS